MITIHKWLVTTSNDTFVAAGTLLGTREDAEEAARKASYPDGEPLSAAQKAYKFNINQVIRPRHGHTENNSGTAEERLPAPLHRSIRPDNVRSSRALRTQ